VNNGTALAHNGMWMGWSDVGMEMVIQGLLDGNSPINDSLAAAALAANYGRYSLEAISSGVFVVMTSEGAWLHLRRGTFKWCADFGVYASDFPSDWPAPRPFGDDAIAFLGKDGPDFECGDWYKYSPRIIHGVYQPGAHIAAQQELLVEELLEELEGEEVAHLEELEEKAELLAGKKYVEVPQ